MTRLLPTLPGTSPGIVGRDPWRVQCAKCAVIVTAENRPGALYGVPPRGGDSAGEPPSAVRCDHPLSSRASLLRRKPPHREGERRSGVPRMQAGEGQRGLLAQPREAPGTEQKGDDMTRILSIDPGNTESGWCVIDADTREPLEFGKWPNSQLRLHILGGYEDVSADHVVIEMVASYGMPVGKEVFETCVWIGRFSEAVRSSWWPNSDPTLVYRKDVKLHHCNHPRATDATIRQALVDRFAPGQRNHGKGTKAAPGWFYGFRADIWQAYALAVYAADTMEELP